MAESAAVRVAREYREQLARNEDAALRRMSRYWVKMERDLEPRFLALAQQIKDMQDSGQVVPDEMIYSLTRYQDMMAQIMQEIPDYEKYAVDIITDYQIENYNLGLEDATAIIRATTPADEIWNMVGKDAAETMAGFAGNGAPLAELLQHDYGDISTTITDALVKGIGLGKGAAAVAKDMREVMGKKEFARSVRIARTEINRAYRIANADQYAKSGVVEKVLRLCYPPTACLACLAMDGEECKNGICDDHPNGKCTTVAVTIGGNYPQWQHGLEWLEEQSEEDQRKIMGDGRYEMWKKDGIPLRDMVEMKPNAVWGGSPTILSIEKIRQNLQNGIFISIPSQSVDWTASEDLRTIKAFIDEKMHSLRAEEKEFGEGAFAYELKIQEVLGLSQESIETTRSMMPFIQKAFENEANRLGEELSARKEPMTRSELRKAKLKLTNFLKTDRPPEAIRKIFADFGIEVEEKTIKASPEWLKRLEELGEPTTELVFRRRK